MINVPDKYEKGYLGLKRNISCHFRVDEGRLEHSLLFKTNNHLEAKSVGVCCYIPQEWFSGRLSKWSSNIEASFSTDMLGVELKLCGMHQISDQGVEDFSGKLAKIANEHLDVLEFYGHCKKLLDAAIELESSDDVEEIRYKFELPLEVAEEDHSPFTRKITPTPYQDFLNDPEGSFGILLQMMGKKVHSLLSKLFEMLAICSFHLSIFFFKLFLLLSFCSHSHLPLKL